MTTITLKQYIDEVPLDIEYDYSPAHYERAGGDHGPRMKVYDSELEILSVTYKGCDMRELVDLVKLHDDIKWDIEHAQEEVA